MIHFTRMSLAAMVLMISVVAVAAQDTTSILHKTQIEKGVSHRAKYGFQMVSGFARRGEMSQRFEIRHGDCGRSSGWDDCNTDRARIERKERPKNAFSKPGQGIWYGYSMYIPSDFVSLGRGNTTLSQAKVEGDLMPLWQMTFNDRPYLLYSDGQTCSLGSLSRWRGKWNDITIYAHYGEGGQQVYFQLFRNGALLCERKTPLMHRSLWGKRQKIGMKYGIYNSFVSRYLAANATKPVNLSGYTQNQSSGTTSKSPAQSPFKIDWGVTLPDHVVLYDEMLAGFRREDVDVRVREAAGLPPVD